MFKNISTAFNIRAFQITCIYMTVVVTFMKSDNDLRWLSVFMKVVTLRFHFQVETMFFSSKKIYHFYIIEYFHLKGLNQNYIKTKVYSDLESEIRRGRTSCHDVQNIYRPIKCLSHLPTIEQKQLNREKFRIEVSRWIRIGFNTLHLRPFHCLFYVETKLLRDYIINHLVLDGS